VEWGPSDMVAPINIYFFLDHPEYGHAVKGNDCFAKFLCFSDVGLFGPFAVVNGVEAPGDALATRVLLDEPVRG